MTLRFTDRIALFNTLAAAITTLLVFCVVYAVVYTTAYNHLDTDIRQEKEEVWLNLHCQGDSIALDLRSEFGENEHKQAEVNPTFLQVIDRHGRVLFRSANLKDDLLLYEPDLAEDKFFNCIFNDKQIRQGQFPIRNATNAVVGQLNIGISQVESALVLHNLRTTLYIAYPLMLLVLYFATSIAAARGIAPVNMLIRAAAHISDSNIDNRLPVPGRQDELRQLAVTINALLDRIERSFRREKQITADVSHELRTPLAAIRGTLEVLVRKRREPEQYEDKVRQVIQEVDRMHLLLDQLLQLARLESGSVAVRRESIELAPFLAALSRKWQPRLEEQQRQLALTVPAGVTVRADTSLLELIVGNLIDNALKYGRAHGTITCAWDASTHSLIVSDDGPGIPHEHLPYLFDRFYRTDSSRNSKVQGAGLGLSIVKKIADLLHVTILVDSSEGVGTTFSLKFQA